MVSNLKDTLAEGAFAFRGYNTTNLGRTPELLSHPRYGPVLQTHLGKASALCSEFLKRKINLEERILAGRESELATFGEDVGLIVGVELAQIAILEEQFDISFPRARLSMGFSLGEISALICSGVFKIEEVLPPILSLADDCAELALDTTMGILFSLEGSLDLDAVRKLCVEICLEGKGLIGISAHLSPNSLLMLGQQQTIERFRLAMADAFPPEMKLNLRKNSDRWPPLHTPLMWAKNIPNRAAMMAYSIPGGLKSPDPDVLSLATGKISYNDYNSREILQLWIDHPQRLWDAIVEMLSSGIETIIHVGPAPNLLPATFKRLSENVSSQLGRGPLGNLGMRAISGIAKRPWLTRMLSARASLLRAPFVKHVVLEDWLLQNGR